MTNKYWNHSNPFFPGSVVRADEANDKFDGIEIGFDMIEGITDGMANTIRTGVLAIVQPQIDQHKTDTDSALHLIRDLTDAEIRNLRDLLTQLDADVDRKLSHTLSFPDAVGNLIYGGHIDPNKVPYFDKDGNVDLLDLPSVTVPAQWAKVYLGRHDGGPTLDNAGQALLPGALYYDNTLNQLQVYRNGRWVPGFMTGSGVVTVGTIAPPTPQTGDLWWDSDTADLMLWYDDGDSQEWVVINSDYNTLFGNMTKQILNDGSTPMKANLQLLQTTAFGPKDAINREYLEQYLRQYAGPSTIIAPHVTAGVNPLSALPVLQGTAKAPPKYDVRIAGNMLFFGNYGALHADYMAPLAGQAVQPGDYVISDGKMWHLARATGLAPGAPAIAGGSAAVAVRATAPRNPPNGTLWFNTGTKKLNIWDAVNKNWDSPSGTTATGLPQATKPGQTLISHGSGSTSNWTAEDFDCGRY